MERRVDNPPSKAQKQLQDEAVVKQMQYLNAYDSADAISTTGSEGGESSSTEGNDSTALAAPNSSQADNTAAGFVSGARVCENDRNAQQIESQTEVKNLDPLDTEDEPLSTPGPDNTEISKERVFEAASSTGSSSSPTLTNANVGGSEANSLAASAQSRPTSLPVYAETPKGVTKGDSGKPPTKSQGSSRKSETKRVTQDQPSQDSPLVSFVAADLEEKIRQANRSLSVTSSTPSGSSHGSKSSSSDYSLASGSSHPGSMATSMSSQFPSSPVDIPEIDPKFLADIEAYARQIATELDGIMRGLNRSLQQMSAISVGCLQTYRETVERSCDTLDSSIKAMYALMARCEELSGQMKFIYRIQNQVHEVKRLLDLFEVQLNRDATSSPK